jgi:hypothetical protein
MCAIVFYVCIYIYLYTQIQFDTKTVVPIVNGYQMII